MFHLALPAAFRSAPVRGLSTLAALVLTTLSGSVALAQTGPVVASTTVAPADTAFQRLLHKYQYPLTQTGTQFSGPGWEKLQQDIRQSALVLVGEDHGMAQIPAFTQAVAEVLQPKVFVAEIDKYQARDLTRLTAQPGLPTAFAQQFPMSLSFYSWAEEFELARALRAQNTTLVGIEQLGFASTSRTLMLMADQVKSKTTRTFLRQQAATIQAHDRAALIAADYGKITINSMRPTLLDSLRKMASTEPLAVRQLLQDLEASVNIFRINAAGKPGGHQARINLMKRNLLTELQPYQQAGQPLPPMLFKFGAYHLSRGRSIWGDIYDVGNLAVNLADSHDQKTLHIFVMGKRGQKITGQNPVDFSKNATAYSSADEAMLKPFMVATPAGTAWQVFDVRPLRRAMLYKNMPVADQELQATILGYDYVVIIPETKASRNY